MIVPSKIALGSGLSSLVRGSGAVYIHPRGRWRSGAASPRIASSQAAERPCASAWPRAPAGPNVLSPMAIQSAARGAGSVSLTAYGAPCPASENVHQTEPVGACPGRWWVVWRIQAPRGRSGSTARR